LTGILRSKDQLPVTSVNYGDSSNLYSYIEYDIGPLICKGKEYYYPHEKRYDMTLPIGSLIPWIKAPNSESQTFSDFKAYTGWIKCDGIETCSEGIYAGQACFDLSNRVLVGSGDEPSMELKNATMPNHHHSHTHTTSSHSHSTPSHSHTTQDHSHTQASHSHSYTDIWYDTQHSLKGGDNRERWVEKTATKYTSYTAPTIYSTNVKVNSASVTVNSATVSVKTQESTPISSVDNATVGDLYSKHLRIDYIFKCF